MPRRRRDDDADNVDLRAPEHEWWAKRPTDPFAPVEPDEIDDGEETDVDEIEPDLPELEPPERPDLPPVDDPGPGTIDEAADPYTVLRVPPNASWEEIVANYRRLARWWHPDGLGAAAEWGRAACEAKIRQLNGAYGELRIRRGR